MTLVLDPTPIGVHASLVEEWDDITRTAKMEPMVRLFDAEEIGLLHRAAKEDHELDKRSYGRADGEGDRG